VINRRNSYLDRDSRCFPKAREKKRSPKLTGRSISAAPSCTRKLPAETLAGFKEIKVTAAEAPSASRAASNVSL
jgi:hypothetical protein